MRGTGAVDCPCLGKNDLFETEDDLRSPVTFGGEHGRMWRRYSFEGSVDGELEVGVVRDLGVGGFVVLRRTVSGGSGESVNNDVNNAESGNEGTSLIARFGNR